MSALDMARRSLEIAIDLNRGGEEERAAAYREEARMWATLALVEEQRTANLIAADRLDSIRTPYEPGTPEYRAFWDRHAATITERLELT